MATVKQCDQCGKTESDPGEAANWLCLGFADGPMMDACSPGCVKQILNNHLKPLLQAMLSAVS